MRSESQPLRLGRETTKRAATPNQGKRVVAVQMVSRLNNGIATAPASRAIARPPKKSPSVTGLPHAQPISPTVSTIDEASNTLPTIRARATDGLAQVSERLTNGARGSHPPFSFQGSLNVA